MHVAVALAVPEQVVAAHRHGPHGRGAHGPVEHVPVVHGLLDDPVARPPPLAEPAEERPPRVRPEDAALDEVADLAAAHGADRLDEVGVGPPLVADLDDLLALPRRL